jgi:uncharacterized membrane protein YfcA
VPDTTLLAIALVALAASSVHAAVGFGSGPLLVPVLLLLVDPATAIVAAVAVGMAVNALQLAAEGRRPRIATRRLIPVWIAAPPGALAGALAAERLDRSTLSLVVAVVLLLCAAAALAMPPALSRSAGLAAGGALAGFSAALTGVFGPVLGLLLLAAGCRGEALRDGIGASFLVVGACAVAAAFAVGAAWPGPVLAAALALPALAGHALGRRAAGRLSAAAQRTGVLATVAVGSLIAVAGAVA